jgi:hypothetical protein
MLKDRVVLVPIRTETDMTGRIPARVAKLAVAILAASALLAVAAGAASAELVFNNNPAAKLGNVNSLQLSQRGISELGAQVDFGHATTANRVSVLMSSWACGNLKGGAECVTSPGATFTWPITLKIYKVQGTGPGEEAITTGANQPGELLKSVTQNASIPFRPSPSKKCPTEGGEENDAFGWYYHGVCHNGKAFQVTYTKAELGSIHLPEKVIISAAFDDSGAAPNVGQWSLNLGLTEKPFETPSVGTMPLENTTDVRLNDFYINSTKQVYYECFTVQPNCTSPGMPAGSLVGQFGIADEWGWWTGAEEANNEYKGGAYQPVFKVAGTHK